MVTDCSRSQNDPCRFAGPLRRRRALAALDDVHADRRADRGRTLPRGPAQGVGAARFRVRWPRDARHRRDPAGARADRVEPLARAAAPRGGGVAAVAREGGTRRAVRADDRRSGRRLCDGRREGLRRGVLRVGRAGLPRQERGTRQDAQPDARRAGVGADRPGHPARCRRLLAPLRVARRHAPADAARARLTADSTRRGTGRSLHQRARGAGEVGAGDLRAAGQHLDVLLQRPLLDAGGEELRDALGDGLERQPRAGDPALHGDDVEAVARGDERRQHAGGGRAEDRLVELRHHLAAAELPEVAAVLAGRAVGELLRARRERRRRRLELGEHALGVLAQRHHRRARHDREQDVARLDQVAGGEALRVRLVVAAALLGRGLRRRDLATRAAAR